MCERKLNRAPYLNKAPMATRVKFLRGTLPGKINIKVIWGSSSQQDLLSNSNSLTSIQNNQLSGNKNHLEIPAEKKAIGDADSNAPVIVEDIPEVLNSNRANNLSQKMNGIIGMSIERKKQQMGSQDAGPSASYYN